MKYHYVWLAWSSGFLLPWLALYVTNPPFRHVMWRVSLVTAALGLTEPIFVPEYWNPPSLFELAQRTGFDIESLIFSFAIGGIGAVLYNALTQRPFGPVSWCCARGTSTTHRRSSRRGPTPRSRGGPGCPMHAISRPPSDGSLAMRPGGRRT